MVDAYVDANVLIRFFTRDHPEMAERARQALAAAAEGRIKLVLTPVVLAEVVWTLNSFYRYGRTQIANDLLSLLAFQGVEVPDREVVAVAISLYGERGMDFGDALLAAYALVEGPRQVCTFDRHFRSIPGLAVMEPGSAPNPTGGN